MTGKQSHCGYCGAPFTAPLWPRKCNRCGTTSYRNPIPVVVVILPVGNGIIVIRRWDRAGKGDTDPAGRLHGHQGDLAGGRSP